MADWNDLDRELEAWAAEGRTATLWWRDDDAVRATAALDRLLDLGDGEGIPVALAVIPAAAEPSLAQSLSGRRGLAILQHGLRHANHAPENAKKAEFGPHRLPAEMIASLRVGREMLGLVPGFVKVLVPPWNRIDESLLAALPGIGIKGISTFAPRRTAHPAPGLRQTNTHVDPIAWHDGRGFVGTAAALDAVVGHLAARRTRTVDADEPTGILTHHLDMDAEGWAFLAGLFARTRAHPAARWIDAHEAFFS